MDNSLGVALNILSFLWIQQQRDSLHVTDADDFIELSVNKRRTAASRRLDSIEDWDVTFHLKLDPVSVHATISLSSASQRLTGRVDTDQWLFNMNNSLKRQSTGRSLWCWVFHFTRHHGIIHNQLKEAMALNIHETPNYTKVQLPWGNARRSSVQIPTFGADHVRIFWPNFGWKKLEWWGDPCVVEKLRP